MSYSALGGGGGGFIRCRLQFSFLLCLPPNRVMMADTASVFSYRAFPCCPISRTVVVISSDLGFPLGWFREFFLVSWFSLLALACLFVHLYYFSREKKLLVEDPTDLELVNTPLRREVKWVSPSGTPSSDGMTSAAKLWEDIEKVLAGGCPTPPQKTFKNHPSCKQFVNFISETLSQRLKIGAVAVWGKVGEL